MSPFASVLASLFLVLLAYLLGLLQAGTRRRYIGPSPIGGVSPAFRDYERRLYRRRAGR